MPWGKYSATLGLAATVCGGCASTLPGTCAMASYRARASFESPRHSAPRCASSPSCRFTFTKACQPEGGADELVEL
eukprot:2733822-Alexandrium_andersonii.AAC.1